MEEQLVLRCLLVLGSLATAAFILRRVRKAQVQIEFQQYFVSGLTIGSVKE